MSFATLRAAVRSIFNTPEEDVERHIRADTESDEMSICKAIIENMCLNAVAEGIEQVRLKEASVDSAKLFHVLETTEEECGELPLEMAIHVAKRIRVMANIDGWGHLTTNPYEMDVLANGQPFLLKIKYFKLQPTLEVLMEVHPFVCP